MGSGLDQTQPRDRRDRAVLGLEMCPGASLGLGVMVPGLEWGPGLWAGTVGPVCSSGTDRKSGRYFGPVSAACVPWKSWPA